MKAATAAVAKAMPPAGGSDGKPRSKRKRQARRPRLGDPHTPQRPDGRARARSPEHGSHAGRDSQPRTLGSGEIPFALDNSGRLYTPDPARRSTLESLHVERRGCRHASARGGLGRGQPPRSIRVYLRDREAAERVAARYPADVRPQPRVRPAGRRPRDRRYRADLSPHDRSASSAHDGCASARRGRFRRARERPFEGRVRHARHGFQPDGDGSRTQSDAGGGDRSGSGASSSCRGRFRSTCCRAPRCDSALQRSKACRFRRARWAATSSTTSSCRPTGWGCSSATSRERA